MILNKREAEIKNFLGISGWSDAVRNPIPGDASTRRYERLAKGHQHAVLMDAPPAAELPGEPEDATPEQRRALGYNAVARLAGASPESFTAIAQALLQRGFSAPQIIAADLERGFVLLEDFGNDIYAKVVQTNPSREPLLYETAVDLLAALYRSSFSSVVKYDTTAWRLRNYDTTALLAETDLCLDWYAKDFERDISETAREAFYAHWITAFETLNAHPSGLALRDFHAENLFWLPQRTGLARTGLIDFQDALFTHPAYDLASLIEDIRRDVSPELTEPLIARFCDKAGLRDGPEFRAAYAVIGTQRSTKLLGFPVRADLKFGKPQYRALLPRVTRHFQNSLSHPALIDIKIWFETYLPDTLK